MESFLVIGRKGLKILDKRTLLDLSSFTSLGQGFRLIE